MGTSIILIIAMSVGLGLLSLGSIFWCVATDTREGNGEFVTKVHSCGKSGPDLAGLSGDGVRDRGLPLWSESSLGLIADTASTR